MKNFRYARAGVTFLALALGGCAYRATFVNDTHPEWTQVKMNQDAYQCMREAAAPGSFGVLVGNSAGVSGSAASGTEIDRSMLRACLAAQGWRETTPTWRKLL